MPIYKISPKAAKSPDHNSDSKGQRVRIPPAAPHKNTPAPSKRCRVFFLLKPYRTGQDSSCALTRVGHTSTSSTSGYPKASGIRQNMRRNGLFWAITPIPTVLCRHRERQILKDGVHAAGKDAQVCAVDGVVNPAAEGFLVIDVEDEDLVFSHYFEMMRHPRLEVKGGINHGGRC